MTFMKMSLSLQVVLIEIQTSTVLMETLFQTLKILLKNLVLVEQIIFQSLQVLKVGGLPVLVVQLL